MYNYVCTREITRECVKERVRVCVKERERERESACRCARVKCTLLQSCMCALDWCVCTVCECVCVLR